MGRERQYADNADRQRAYRQRKAEEYARLKDAATGKTAHRDKLRKRLVRILGMLGSDIPVERDKAARAATQMIKEAGLTWYDVLNVTDEK